MLIYYSNFKDFNNNDIRLEIYKDSTDTTKELLLASDAITIRYEGENDIFKPLKCSGCTISILTKELLDNLYSGKGKEIYCKIFRGGKLFWFGYITPNIYSSDYVDEYNLLQLEYIDIISILGNYNFTYTTGKKQVTSFYNIITHILNKVDKDKIINSIYVQDSRAINNNPDLLNNLYINERNFFDESDEAEKCKNILEYIAAYLGMTLVQYEDKLLFVDYESTTNKFIAYNRTDNTVSNKTITVNTVNINSSIYESNATISMNDIFNKIIVIGNNNPIGNMIPDIFDDLVNYNVDQNKYYTTQETIDKVDYTLLTALFKSENNYNALAPNNILGDIGEITINNVNNIIKGAYWQKVDSYKDEDGEPSTLRWKEYLTFYDNAIYKVDANFLSIKNKEMVIFKGGYLIANLTYKMSGHHLAHNVKTTKALNSTYDNFTKTKYNDGFKDTWIPCRL